MALLIVVWLGICVTALAMLWRYKNIPGTVGKVQSQWPVASKLVRPAGPVLMMFAHPMCPCTTASLSELRVLMSRFAGQLTAEVVFIRSDGEDEDWAQGDSRKAAESIPGLRIIEDPSGIEAKRFGAETSGHTMLFDANGRLLFNGGITSARGHEGENRGVDEITALLRHEKEAAPATSVFGCSLEDPDQKEQ